MSRVQVPLLTPDGSGVNSSPRDLLGWDFILALFSFLGGPGVPHSCLLVPDIVERTIGLALHYHREELDLCGEAIALDPVLGGADSVHVASAVRLGVDKVTIVTHDAQMARAAVSLGFDVLDPVTDDPGRPAVV